MKVAINLTLVKGWYDMILSGKKKEEYRSEKNKLVKKLYHKAFDNPIKFFKEKPVVIFRNGYRMDSRAMVVEIEGFDYRFKDKEIEHPEWGEPLIKGDEGHFVIKLGKVRCKGGTYADVKEWCKKHGVVTM